MGVVRFISSPPLNCRHVIRSTRNVIVFVELNLKMKPMVFISHSSRDTWVAKQIAAHVKCVGAETFLDEADIEHGDDFDDEIVKASKRCTELLVLLTPWAVER